MLYQVDKQACLHNKIYIYGAGYVMQISKLFCLQIIHYCKMFWGHNSIVEGTMSLLNDNLPRNHNLCEKV